MLVSDFDFELPKSCIAQHPVTPRDHAKMLAVSDQLRDYHIKDLPSLIRSNDLLVFNNTKVIPTRLNIFQNNKKIEVTLIKQLDDCTWKAFAKPARKLQLHQRAFITDDISCEVISKDDSGVVLAFNRSGHALLDVFYSYGAMPLPPYIKRDLSDDNQVKEDGKDYQTIFAASEGAVAAPTAGLHFTDAMMHTFKDRGINHVMVTLHVGAGTFLPVKVEDTNDHVMHSEYGYISQEVADKINLAKKQGGRVIAVGTTSLRLLESATGASGVIKPFDQETDIFITPGYRFKMVDILLTNFHLPKSTLFMLVAAFSGLARMKDAYAYAINHGYRFYSYGDACLLQRDAGKNE